MHNYESIVVVGHYLTFLDWPANSANPVRFRILGQECSRNVESA